MSAITLRPICDGDDGVMHDMFVAIRRGPMDAAGFDPVTVERLMRHQFDMQRAGYRFACPTATWEAILADGVVVGRMVTDDDGAHVMLVDIMVDPAHQGQGHGSQALAALIDRAGKRPIELRVDHGSRAERWYHRHGFARVGADDLQAHLVRVPTATVLAATGA
jgi:GNAT superfamily N-acetyltransferase